MFAKAKLENEPICHIIYCLEIATSPFSIAQFWILETPLANMKREMRLIAISRPCATRPIGLDLWKSSNTQNWYWSTMIKTEPVIIKVKIVKKTMFNLRPNL